MSFRFTQRVATTLRLSALAGEAMNPQNFNDFAALTPEAC